MIKIAKAINSFAPVAQQADVQPAEDSIFVLTSSQLQDIITKAVQDATERLYLEIAYDRQRISRLEQKEPGPLQKDRADILRALLAVNGGKMLTKEARQKMHLSKERFSNLLGMCGDFVQTKPYHLDRRQTVIILKNQLVSTNY